MRTTVFEVFYIGGNTGWAVAEFDFHTRDQIGETWYERRKADAIAEARRRSADKAVRIFARNNRLLRTVIGRA